jgi:ribosomal protein S18 acetylase RimI-like enzyme
VKTKVIKYWESIGKEMMIITEMTQATDEIQNAFKRLIPQLTQHSPPPSKKMLAEMAASDQVFVFLAREGAGDGRILGAATLATFITPTGIHGWIEDVVVDREGRRQGIGRTLTEACLEKARELGLPEVNLTSRPSREAANKLYQEMGFQQRQTNVYRYPLD